MDLSPPQRRDLRARAHHLHPVVIISSNGLTDAVIKAIDTSLTAHELIKVKAVADEREQRQAWLDEICSRLDCAPVQTIGKILILFRPRPEAPPQEAPRRSSARPVKPRTQRAAAEFIAKRLKGLKEPKDGTGRTRSAVPSNKPARGNTAARPARTVHRAPRRRPGS